MLVIRAFNLEEHLSHASIASLDGQEDSSSLCVLTFPLWHLIFFFNSSSRTVWEAEPPVQQLQGGNEPPRV